MHIDKKRRWHTLYSLVSILIEEAAIIAVALWVLPHFGIKIPFWILIVLVIAWAIYSYLGFRIGRKTLSKAPVVGTEAMIGLRCKATTTLSPGGYVRVDGELWAAYSVAGDISPGTEMVITEVKGLTVFVRPLSSADSDEPESNNHHGGS
jgi:membrane protein implicated in regulation of membrane protease activity